MPDQPPREDPMAPPTEPLTIPARWTDDCQGKKDYDGELVSISTRYWPAGGGFWMMRRGPGFVEIDESPAPEIRPSAKSSILLHYGDPEDADDLTLASQDFEADTQEEVQRAVEEWAAVQYRRVVEALQREFATPTGDRPHG